MKKYLLLLILPFIFLNIVKAEEYDSCYDSFNKVTFSVSSFIFGYYRIRPTITDFDNSKVYYVKFFPNTDEFDITKIIDHVLIWDSSGNGICTGSDVFSNSNCAIENINYDTVNNIISFSGSNIINGSMIQLLISYNPSNDLTNTPLVFTTDSNSFNTCLSNSSSNSNSVYSSFITLYLDRIGYLANGFTTNPYLLAMVGIIFSFIVLEILLHLIHLKGGYKK